MSDRIDLSRSRLRAEREAGFDLQRFDLQQFNQGYVGVLKSSPATATAVTSNLTDSTLFTATDNIFTLPANFFTFVGQMLRITIGGQMSNIITTPGTLTPTVYFGSVKVFAGAALQLNAVAKTNVSWLMTLLLVCRSVGSGTAATMLGLGTFASESIVGSPVPASGGAGQLLLPATAPAAGTGFDCTASQAVDVRANFSLTGNSITSMLYVLESLN